LARDGLLICLSISTKLNRQANTVEIRKGWTMLDPETIDHLFGIYEVKVYKNGLEIIRRRRTKGAVAKPAARKGVYDMSKKSRLRLTHIVANCETGFVSMFTLTYGDVFIPVDGRELKRQVNVFLKSFRKRFDQRYIWFLEFTKTQRPHLHVITTVQPSEFDRRWLGARWATISVVGAYKKLQRRLDTDPEATFIDIDPVVITDEQNKVAAVHSHPKAWEQIRKRDGAVRYLLKYATKEEQKLVPVGFTNVGRFWGTSQNLEILELATIRVGRDMTEDQVKEMFQGHRVEKYPLIPRYVFERDAWEYFTARGVTLRKINGKKGRKVITKSTKL